MDTLPPQQGPCQFPPRITRISEGPTTKSPRRTRLFQRVAAAVGTIAINMALLTAQATAETAYTGLFTPTVNTTTWTLTHGNFNPANISGNQTVYQLETPASDFIWGTGMVATSVADWSTDGSDNYAIAWGQTNNLARVSSYDDDSTVTRNEVRSAAAFFPYTLGAKSANMNNTTVLSGNTAGLSFLNPSTGRYIIDGLPAPAGSRSGLLMPFKHGTDTTFSTNPIPNGFALSSRQLTSTSWEVLNYNNDQNLEALNNWGWIYIPDTAEGVLAGHVAGNGTMTALTDATSLLSLAGAGANNGWTSTGYFEFLVDGGNINPGTHALFVQGDSADSSAQDNIWSWTPDGTTSGGANSFGVHTIDLPAWAGDTASFNFMLVPYTGVVVVPEPSTYALVLLAAGGLALMHRRRHRRN